MKVITKFGEIFEPKIKDLITAIENLDKKSDEFVVVERNEKDFIQGFVPQKNKNLYIIEKPLNGNQKYELRTSKEKAKQIFIDFYSGKDWKDLGKWHFSTEKEKLIPLTIEEHSTIKKLIQTMLKDLNSIKDHDWQEWVVGFKQRIDKKAKYQNKISHHLQVTWRAF